jgi:hypothetical protein
MHKQQYVLINIFRVLGQSLHNLVVVVCNTFINVLSLTTDKFVHLRKFTIARQCKKT